MFYVFYIVVCFVVVKDVGLYKIEKNAAFSLANLTSYLYITDIRKHFL